MATLMERPEVESRGVQNTARGASQLRTVALLWVAATALYIFGLTGFLFVLEFSNRMSSAAGLFASLLGALIVLAGGGAQYLALRRGLRTTGQPVRPGPLGWIGVTLFAAVAAAIPVFFTANAWTIREWFIVGDSSSNVADHATDLVLGGLVIGGAGGAIVGAVMGSIQWDILQSALAQCAWVGSSVLGWLLSGAAGLGLLTWFSVITEEARADALLTWVVMAVVALILAIVPGLFTARALMRGLAGVARPGAAQS